MTKRDRSAEFFPVEGSRRAPPPEEKTVTTVRLYSDDVEMIQRNYGEISVPIRRMVRKLADRLRKDHDIEPKGQPKE